MKKRVWVKTKRGQALVEVDDAPKPSKRSTLDVGVFNQSPSGWPMKSDAMGINPSQIPDAMKADAEMGVKVEYDRHTGQVIYDSPAQRKQHCEVHGFFDRNGSYGDPQRGGRS